MPDAREEVLRYTLDGAEYTKRDGMWEVGACYRVHPTLAVALDELVSLRAARDAAEREREEAVEVSAAHLEALVEVENALRAAEAQRDAAQAALQMSTALIRDLASQRIKGEEAQRRLDTIIGAALPAAEGEG